MLWLAIPLHIGELGHHSLKIFVCCLFDVKTFGKEMLTSVISWRTFVPHTKSFQRSQLYHEALMKEYYKLSIYYRPINSPLSRQNGHHFHRQHFQMHFHEWKVLYFHSNFTPNRQQAINWTNADPVHWCIYAALGGDELNMILHMTQQLQR